MIDDDLAVAHRLATLADGISSGRFASREFGVRLKPDGSAVTDVDVQIEVALRTEISITRPSDQFLSEELGEDAAAGETTRRWIVDGIDGTGAFIAGELTWGTLIALVEEGEVQVGVASAPGLRRRWWAARGRGAWSATTDERGAVGEPSRLTVARASQELRGTVLPPAGLLEGWRDDAVRHALAMLTPPAGSLHGPLLVASGEAEASVHLWGGAWDHAPFVVLVEEAGGTFSDLWGGRRIDTATAVFSNGASHDAVRQRILEAAPPHPDLP